MKPPPFDYHTPATLDEALGLLAEIDGVMALAGGQSLVQLLKFRRVKPSALVDLNGVAGLDELDEHDGELHVGALVRQQRLVDNEVVALRWPLLSEAAAHIGYAETRRRGTVGGSLAFGAPWAELSAATVALDAAIDVRSAAGERTIRARSFFLGPHRTALEPGELVVRVRVPAPPARSGSAFREVSARYRDYAQLAAAAVVTPDGAELVLLRAAPAPLHLDASDALGDDASLDERLSEIEPEDDVEVSAVYRRRVARVLARRALAAAAARMEESA